MSIHLNEKSCGHGIIRMMRNLLESIKTQNVCNIIVFRLSGSFTAAIRTSNQLVIFFPSTMQYA